MPKDRRNLMANARRTSFELSVDGSALSLVCNQELGLCLSTYAGEHEIKTQISGTRIHVADVLYDDVRTVQSGITQILESHGFGVLEVE